MKLWGYDDGMQYYTGVGHSSAIVKVITCYSRLLLVLIKDSLFQSDKKDPFSYGKHLKKF
jgi:hypothetical protein